MRELKFKIGDVVRVTATTPIDDAFGVKIGMVGLVEMAEPCMDNGEEVYLYHILRIRKPDETALPHIYTSEDCLELVPDESVAPKVLDEYEDKVLEFLGTPEGITGIIKLMGVK